MPFRLAHISDVHVSAPSSTPSPASTSFFKHVATNKRLLGWLTLRTARGADAYPPAVFAAALADMWGGAPTPTPRVGTGERAGGGGEEGGGGWGGVDHTVLTGDVTNLSLVAEFAAARALVDAAFFARVDAATAAAVAEGGGGAATAVNGGAPNGTMDSSGSDSGSDDSGDSGDVSGGGDGRSRGGAVAPLASLLSVIPGNHDAYLPRTVTSSLFAKYFGDVATPDMNFGRFATAGSERHRRHHHRRHNHRRRSSHRHPQDTHDPHRRGVGGAPPPLALMAGETPALPPDPTAAVRPPPPVAYANGGTPSPPASAAVPPAAVAATTVATPAVPEAAAAPPPPDGRPPPDYVNPPPGTLPSPYEDEDHLPREAGFPYVKLLGPAKAIALVCLNSGVATSAFESCGTVGAAQAAAADAACGAAVEAGARFLVVAVHHPPRVCHGAWKEANRGLGDIWRLTRLCARWEVGLLLHGHNHVPYRGWMDGSPSTLIADAGSGTYVGGGTDVMARYNVYEIDEGGGGLVGISARVWDPSTEGFSTLPLGIPPRPAGVVPAEGGGG